MSVTVSLAVNLDGLFSCEVIAWWLIACRSEMFVPWLLVCGSDKDTKHLQNEMVIV